MRTTASTVAILLLGVLSILLSQSGHGDSFRLFRTGKVSWRSSRRRLGVFFFEEGSTATKAAAKTDANECYYNVLEVHTTCSQRDIKTAFWKLVKIYHPDKKKSFDAKELAHKQMMIINTAYETLKDPKKRQQYDIKKAMQDKGRDNKETIDGKTNEYYAQGAETAGTSTMEDIYQTSLRELQV